MVKYKRDVWARKGPVEKSELRDTDLWMTVATVTLPRLHILLFYRKCSKCDQDAVKHHLHVGTTSPPPPVPSSMWF